MRRAADRHFRRASPGREFADRVPARTSRSGIVKTGKGSALFGDRALKHPETVIGDVFSLGVRPRVCRIKIIAPVNRAL